jgi:hypothetical protein
VEGDMARHAQVLIRPEKANVMRLPIMATLYFARLPVSTFHITIKTSAF